MSNNQQGGRLGQGQIKSKFGHRLDMKAGSTYRLRLLRPKKDVDFLYADRVWVDAPDDAGDVKRRPVPWPGEDAARQIRCYDNTPLSALEPATEYHFMAWDYGSGELVWIIPSQKSAGRLEELAGDSDSYGDIFSYDLKVTVKTGNRGYRDYQWDPLTNKTDPLDDDINAKIRESIRAVWDDMKFEEMSPEEIALAIGGTFAGVNTQRRDFEDEPDDGMLPPGDDAEPAAEKGTPGGVGQRGKGVAEPLEGWDG